MIDAEARKGPPRGAFLPQSVMHFYSGPPMHFLSGVDTWSRKIVGWAMANHLRAELVLEAMEMAVGQRSRPPSR
jgi:hypothetical protein